MISLNQIIGSGARRELLLETPVKAVDQLVDKNHLFPIGQGNGESIVEFFESRQCIRTPDAFLAPTLVILQSGRLPVAVLRRANCDSLAARSVYPEDGVTTGTSHFVSRHHQNRLTAHVKSKPHIIAEFIILEAERVRFIEPFNENRSNTWRPGDAFAFSFQLFPEQSICRCGCFHSCHHAIMTHYPIGVTNWK